MRWTVRATACVASTQNASATTVNVTMAGWAMIVICSDAMTCTRASTAPDASKYFTKKREKKGLFGLRRWSLPCGEGGGGGGGWKLVIATCRGATTCTRVSTEPGASKHIGSVIYVKGQLI